MAGPSVEDDDEVPPPLEDMSSYIHGMCFNKRSEKKQPAAGGSAIGPSNSSKSGPKHDKASLLDDSFSHTTAKIVESVITEREVQKPSSTEPPFKKGFLNASCDKKPTKKPSKEIPFVKGSGKSEIPEFMKVSRPVDQYREELQRMLKPTQELVSEVLQNEGIKGGLEDPEIMAAVQDIASDPNAMHKYRNNPKVTNFYAQLGNLMGSKIEKQSKEAVQRQRSVKHLK